MEEAHIAQRRGTTRSPTEGELCVHRVSHLYFRDWCAKQALQDEVEIGLIDPVKVLDKDTAWCLYDRIERSS